MSGIVRPPLMAHMAILKPCPFCGSKWTQVRWIGFEDSLNSGYAPGYRGECTDCGAMTLAALSVEAAAEAWDRRANDVRPVKEGEWRYKTMTVPGGKGQTYAKWCCSKCKSKFKDHSKFCPNCGADMRLEGGANDG